MFESEISFIEISKEENSHNYLQMMHGFLKSMFEKVEDFINTISFNDHKSGLKRFSYQGKCNGENWGEHYWAEKAWKMLKNETVDDRNKLYNCGEIPWPCEAC